MSASRTIDISPLLPYAHLLHPGVAAEQIAPAKPHDEVKLTWWHCKTLERVLSNRDRAKIQALEWGLSEEAADRRALEAYPDFMIVYALAQFGWSHEQIEAFLRDVLGDGPVEMRRWRAKCLEPLAPGCRPPAYKPLRRRVRDQAPSGFSGLVTRQGVKNPQGLFWWGEWMIHLNGFRVEVLPDTRATASCFAGLEIDDPPYLGGAHLISAFSR